MWELTHSTTPYDPEGRDGDRDKLQIVPEPSPLCWEGYHFWLDYLYESHSDSDDWPDSWKVPPFQDRLVNGLATNDFSNIPAAELPIAVPHLFKAAGRSPDELFKEALRFSIMSRNDKLMEGLLEQLPKNKIDISGLYPLHLATSYLDDASCCTVFKSLAYDDLGKDSFRERREFYINEFGHTVLDNLMIAILKAHTSTLPVKVDKQFRHEQRFVGEEVDICGRWDADSECFRSLLAQGQTCIPFRWKHKFCHTSVLTICHCIITANI